MHLDRTHKNFDNLANVTNRRKICDLLRQDSELFKINPITAGGAADEGENCDQLNNPWSQDFDFSDDDDS